MKKILLVAGSVITMYSNAQTINFTQPSDGSESTYCGIPTSAIQDQVLSSPERFGHSLQGQYGNPWSTWSAIGRPNLGWAPVDRSFYGYFVNNQSDRVFFGLKNVATKGQTTNPNLPTATAGTDSSDAVVAWGDDRTRLFFEFHGYQPGCNAAVRQVAQMTHDGKMGIGQSPGVRPDARFHVNVSNNLPSGDNTTVNGIRFQGLPTVLYDTVLVIDPAGNLAKRVYGGGSPASILNCNLANYVPKVGPAGNNLNCSQIYDNGASVGIGFTSFNFNYTFLGTAQLNGPAPASSVGTLRLDVNGVTRAECYLAFSDERYKKEIAPVKDALSLVNKLEGKTYFWRTDEFKEKGFTTARQYGFIAQELEKIIPEVVATDDKGYKSVNYDMVIPILTQAIKEQQAQITALESRLAATENKTGSANGVNQINSAADGFALQQNIPNPFTNETVINYTLPQQIKTASLVVYDLSGKQVSTFPLEKANTSITLTSDKLSAGIYIYSVMADGKIMDSKRMVVANK